MTMVPPGREEGVSARPEFVALSERDIWAALDRGGDSNPVVAEITRLAAIYMIRCRECISEANATTPMKLNARWPIEKIAVLVMRDFLRQARPAPRDAWH